MRFVMFLCLLLFPGAAHAEWLKASSAHFVVSADDSEKDIRRFSRDLEGFHAAMAISLGQKLEIPSPSNRVMIFVVRNKREVRKLLAKVAGILAVSICRAQVGRLRLSRGSS